MFNLKASNYEIKLFNKYWAKKDNTIYNELSRVSFLEPNNITTINLFNDRIVVTSDIINSIPLFYTIYNGKFILTDNAYFVFEESLNKSFEKSELINYFNLKHSLLSNTIISNIKQIKAAERITFDLKENNILSEDTFFFRKDGPIYEDNEQVLKHKCKEIICNVFERFSSEIKNNQIIIPLSGGMDSRLIATLFKLFNLENNIVCISYGPTNNEDAVIGNKVAKKLGLRWIFIEYNEEKLRNCILHEKFANFLLFAHNLSRTPHIQDYFAIKELHENKVIEKDAIFIFGHTGDFIAGEYLSKYCNDIFDSIYIMDCIRYYRNEDLKIYLNNYFRSLRNIINICNLFDLLEIYNWRERHAKFIVNSLRAVDYFGYNWRIPLWDYKLVSFWSKVSNEKRMNRELWYEIIDNEFFRQFGVDTNQIPRGSVFRRNDLNLFIKNLIIKNKFRWAFSVIKEFAYKLNIVDYQENKHPLFPGIKRRLIKKDNLFKIYRKFGYFSPGKEVNAIVNDLTFYLLNKKYNKIFYPNY